MKLLFVYNAKFKKDTEENFYTDGFINEEVWQRYTNISDDLKVLSRLDEYRYDENYAKKHFNFFDKSTKKFIPIPDLYSNLVNFFMLRKALKRIIKENVINSDYLIVRIPNNVGNIAINFAKKCNKPYLLEIVGCVWDALWNHSLRGKFLAPFNYYVTKKCVRNAEYVVYVTNEFLQKKYPTNGKGINCSDVSLNEFNDNVLESRLRKILKMDMKSKIIIGTTAAMNIRYKGQQFIIKALGNLKKQGITNYEYQLIGGGDQSYLKLIAKKYNVSEQVKFLGTLPHKKVFEWLDSIDLYVQPSQTEGLPRALIEAMSRGLPSFGTKTGGIPELLEEEYLFSNTRNNVKEICLILQNFTKEDMILQAKRNYEEARKYEKSIIEDRRRKFFEEFISDYKVKGQEQGQC